jgi:hypothetical protein
MPFAQEPGLPGDGIMSLPASRVTRRTFAVAGVLLFAISAASCGDNEPEQRKAFIAFLQTRIIDKPGLHIPILSEKETADVGPYAEQYKILNGFHHTLNETVSKDMARVMQVGAPRSLEELRGQRGAIALIKDGMGKMRAELDKAEGSADAARKKLKQPPDLKAVYDAAFTRMVTKPAAVFRELMPAVESMLPRIEALAAFLDEHRDAIELHGNQIAIKDAALRKQAAALFEGAIEAAKVADEGKRKLRAMAEGK